MFNMSSTDTTIVLKTYYGPNSYSKFKLNTLKIYHWTFCASKNIIGFRIVMFDKLA